MKASRQLNSSIIEAIKKAGILWVLIALSVVIALISPNFIKPINIITIFKQISMLGILAIGSTFVLISGGIDLSVGSIVALSGVSAALVAGQAQNLPIVVPFIAALFSGMAIGLLNGLGVAFLGVPPFIMTLGFMSSARGLALL